MANESEPGSSDGGPPAFEIVTARLDVAPETVRAAAALLSDAERRRAGRFVLERDRRRFIVARSRLRHLVGARLGMSPRAVRLVSGRHGKPALASRSAHQDLRFNVSHCGELAVYAFSVARDIGIDLEAVRTMRDAGDIAAGFFSAREHDAYRALDLCQRPQGFFNCWTRKEAFVKALGDGLHCPLDAFDVSLAPGEPARVLRVGNVFGEACGWLLHSFSPAPGFVGAVALRTSIEGSASSAALTSSLPKQKCLP